MTPISILLPTFDAGRFLAPQIASIAAQTHAAFELLVADDGSGDDTVAETARLAAADARIRIVPTTGNRGQKRRLAELAGEARHELIAVADQDDVWHPAKLARLVAALGEAAMAFGPSWIIDADGAEQGMTLLDMLRPLPSADDRLTYLFKPMVSAHAMLTRRAVFAPMTMAREHPFDWLQSLDAMFAGGVRFVPEAVTFHRIHGGNQSNARSGRRFSLGQRVSPFELRRKRNLRLTERWMFVQRLEHLAFSELIAADLRATFARALRLCAAAWFEQDRALHLKHAKLGAAVMALLEPLAGSPRDLAFARRSMERLTRAAIHPYNVAWEAALMLRGPRRPAQTTPAA